MMLQRTKTALLVAALLGPAPALAQDVALPEPVAPTQTGKEGEPDVSLDVNKEIDLANVVTSAAKGVTTVQEAPAIITIITADDIKARGFRQMTEALATIPGWLETSAVGNQLGQMLVRGVGQAQLLLHDGVSMFEPWGNNTNLTRTHPLENIKRIEVVTGPGGVLWGADSFLGIVNVISKDAEDVNGVELNAGYGDGPGNNQDFRAYAMFGKSFLKNKLKVFLHGSYETYIGSRFELPQVFASSPAPQPGGPAFYGSVANPEPERSWLVHFDGKITAGPVSVYFQIPVGDNHPQLVFNNAVVPHDTWNIYDRYVIAEYKDRFLKGDKLGLTIKAYWTQFVRDYTINLFPKNSALPDGFTFGFAGQMVQHAGLTIDSDVTLPANIRLLYGGEFLWESLTNSVDTFQAPSNPKELPIYCPVASPGDPGFVDGYVKNCPRTFVNDSSRYVGALYLNGQWRPIRQLTFDGGVRLQQGYGQHGYDLTPLGSAAIVWNFVPDFHLKANYATGFRPPVFFNLAAALGGVQYGANPDLKNELSQSFQGEVNARILKNVRKVRELELRIDYSYTFLKNLIQISDGSYRNTGDRAIHSVEAYARLYLNGDHFMQASYTFLYATSSDAGVIHTSPNNWFVLGASFNLVKNMLDVNANLTVLGAYKDPNRYPSGQSPLTGASTGTQERTTDLTFDRLTPVALLQLGGRLRLFKEHMSITAQFYNVLNQHYYFPDFFGDLTPTTEMSPTPAPGFSFFASVGYHN